MGHEEDRMKNEKTKPAAKKTKDVVEEQVTVKSAAQKEKTKTKKIAVAPDTEPKVKKAKSAKGDQKMVEPKEKKAPKEDKVTKFLVSMKKSVRKSIKKEAAEIGISMNDYIVLAVEGKLSQDSVSRT
jgi:predicted HicB family RNase H-like nuclease